MKTTIDWTRIVSQDRAKAVGIPWTREEERAIKDGISADDVRAGILDIESKKAADESEEVILARLPIEELNETAKGMGIEFDEGAVVKADIINEIESEEAKVKELLKMTRPELSNLAKSLGVVFEYIKTTKTDFVDLIKKARKTK